MCRASVYATTNNGSDDRSFQMQAAFGRQAPFPGAVHAGGFSLEPNAAS